MRTEQVIINLLLNTCQASDRPRLSRVRVIAAMNQDLGTSSHPSPPLSRRLGGRSRVEPDSYSPWHGGMP